MADDILKRCPRCDTKKALAEFPAKIKICYCVPCEAAYKREHYAKNAETYKARTRQWAADNPERKKAGDKAYRKANPDRVLEKARMWTAQNPAARKAIYTKSRQANIAAYRAREASYRERHRLICNARIREWKKANPHACVMYAGKRRAAEIQALPSWADLDAIAAVYKDAQTRGLTVDHVVPLLSEFVCGFHCETNMQLLSLSENSRKNNRHWPDMW